MPKWSFSLELMHRHFVDGHVINLDIALGKGGGGQDV
jgi:hypothetical protein